MQYTLHLQEFLTVQLRLTEYPDLFLLETLQRNHFNSKLKIRS